MTSEQTSEQTPKPTSEQEPKTKLELVKTSDGSYTFYNPEVDQCYHTRTGAIEEALEKHVRPSKIVEKAKEQGSIVIGDLFFGLGYNSIVAITKIREVCPNCEIKILAFENDYEILNNIKEMKLPEEYREAQELIVSLVESEPSKEKSTPLFKLHRFKSEDEKTKLLLFVGDARQSLKTISPNILDVVFFDPFSPSKVPELWSLSFFLTVWRKMKTGSLLTTYSCARMVRDNLRDANFIVEDGPSVGRKSPSTIATKVDLRKLFSKKKGN